jgi:hypothetical protein
LRNERSEDIEQIENITALNLDNADHLEVLLSRWRGQCIPGELQRISENTVRILDLLRKLRRGRKA